MSRVVPALLLVVVAACALGAEAGRHRRSVIDSGVDMPKAAPDTSRGLLGTATRVLLEAYSEPQGGYYGYYGYYGVPSEWEAAYDVEMSGLRRQLLAWDAQEYGAGSYGYYYGYYSSPDVEEEMVAMTRRLLEEEGFVIGAGNKDAGFIVGGKPVGVSDYLPWALGGYGGYGVYGYGYYAGWYFGNMVAGVEFGSVEVPEIPDW